MKVDSQISLRERIRLNLVAAMRVAGISQVQLAEKLGISKGTVNNWTRGNNSPDVDMVPQICEVLGIPIIDFYSDGYNDSSSLRLKAPPISDEAMKLAKDYDGLDHWGQRQVRSTADIEAARVADERHRKLQIIPEASEETIRLPVNLAAAAEGDGFGAWLDNSYDPITVRLNDTTRKADMVLKVQGRSMEPSYQDGEYVLVRFQPDIEVGEVGIWTIDGLGYVKERGKDRLISHNPDVPDIIIGEQECICVGKVIGELSPEWVLEE